MALLSEDMKKLAEAHRLARRTAAVIRQNLTVAIGAMLVLVTSGLFFDLPLPLAVVGHEGGTVLVVLNGLRLLSDRIRRNAVEAMSARRTLERQSASTPFSKSARQKNGLGIGWETAVEQERKSIEFQCCYHACSNPKRADSSHTNPKSVAAEPCGYDSFDERIHTDRNQNGLGCKLRLDHL